MCDKEKIDLLVKFAYYMYHYVNFASNDSNNKHWYNEELDVDFTHRELAEYFMSKDIEILNF